jgi:hypothetical protein
MNLRCFDGFPFSKVLNMRMSERGIASRASRELRTPASIVLLAALLLPALTYSVTAADEKAVKDADKSAPAERKDADDKEGWQPLFNGKDLEGWKVTDFGGQGEVYVEDGEVVISQGADLSGVHTEKELPKSNYEVEFEAQRSAGGDFFAGLTFPVKDTHCSLIVGGWGGGVCGLSSLNGMDASENETTSYHQFEKGKWYKIRLIVRDNHITAWLDKHKLVDVDTTDQKIGLRFEVERSKPFGFSTWQTTARLKNARIRPLSKEEQKAE